MDKEADALYIRLDEAAVVESEEVQSDVIVDFDQGGRIVAFEALQPSTWESPIELELVNRQRGSA